MSFGSGDPTIEDAIKELIAFEDVPDVPAHVMDSIVTRQLSRLMRSLNQLLDLPDYRDRAERAIIRIGFQV